MANHESAECAGPPPPDDLTPICEVGGAFDETSVTLSVYSKHLDRHKVSEVLEAQPTKAWNPGESHLIGTSQRTRVVDWGKWLLMIAHDSSPVEAKIKRLLAACTRNLENWRLLADEYETWLTIAGHLDGWNRELLLSRETLALLTERGLALHVDVYFDGDDDEGTERA